MSLIREIKNEEDLERWERSIAYAVIIDFINRCNEYTRSKSNRTINLEALITDMPVAVCIANLLDDCIYFVHRVPLISQESSRFGNPAFRNWIQHISEIILPNWRNVMSSLLENETLSNYIDATIIEELSEYFENSLGSSVRIDYGTGHELSFLAFLCCCEKIQCWPLEKSGAMVNILLRKYLKLVRTSQKYFRLEPAGSHGVWGLDDYQFLPFLFGSSQLCDCENNILSNPEVVTNRGLVNVYKEEYLYLDAIAFIYDVKSGPFHEHSPILYDISGISSWEKINSGMIKMYKKEVLGKFPVVQHFLFGKLLPWNVLKI